MHARARPLEKPLLAALVGIAVLCVAGIVWPDTQWMPAFRIAALLALVAVIATILRAGDFRLLLNPPLLLALQAIVLYSLLIWAAILVGDSEWGATVSSQKLRGYMGSRAELLVLTFGIVCLAVAVGPLVSRAPRTANRPDPSEPGRTARLLAFLAIACGGATFFALEANVPAVTEFASAGLGRQLHDVLPAVIAFSLAAAVYDGAGRSIVSTAGVAIVALYSAWGMAQAMQAPVPIYMGLGLALLWLGRISFSPGKVAAWGLCVVFALVLALALKTHLVNERQSAPVEVSFGQLVLAKAVERQMTSAGCLANIVANEASAGRPGNALYFAAAVVPRLLWQDKPSLSRGADFAQRHCGAVISHDPKHSESITLLGEPVIEAGYVGLFAGAAAILLVSAGALACVFSGSPLGRITVTALIPWIAAFQQHLGLYFANTFKMLLAMAPLIVAYWLWDRYVRDGRSPARTN